MIKLIATDVDGTLVKDGTLLIDPEYMTVVSRLVDQGIHFVVCSGRQFSSEQKLSPDQGPPALHPPMAELSCAHRKRF